MKYFGLIGYPLSHSFSKKYFTEKFEREGVQDCHYESFSLASITELPALLKRNPLLAGLNVTIPYKEQVLDYLDVKTGVVAATGACNCIKITGGKLTGYNTDVAGFKTALQKHLAPSHTRALILGTGGAAKAVEYVLSELGIAHKYVSRKPTVNHLSYEQVTDKILDEFTLIINATPLGMYPNITEAPAIPYHYLGGKHYLFDLIYNPEKTLFLKKGEEQGAAVQNGMDMLVVQAEESWRIWNEG
jgi:shikimate dehydrogenase